MKQTHSKASAQVQAQKSARASLVSGSNLNFSVSTLGPASYSKGIPESSEKKKGIVVGSSRIQKPPTCISPTIQSNSNFDRKRPEPLMISPTKRESQIFGQGQNSAIPGLSPIVSVNQLGMNSAVPRPLQQALALNPIPSGTTMQSPTRLNDSRNMNQSVDLTSNTTINEGNSTFHYKPEIMNSFSGLSNGRPKCDVSMLNQTRFDKKTKDGSYWQENTLISAKNARIHNLGTIPEVNNSHVSIRGSFKKEQGLTKKQQAPGLRKETNNEGRSMAQALNTTTAKEKVTLLNKENTTQNAIASGNITVRAFSPKSKTASSSFVLEHKPTQKAQAPSQTGLWEAPEKVQERNLLDKTIQSKTDRSKIQKNEAYFTSQCSTLPGPQKGLHAGKVNKDTYTSKKKDESTILNRSMNQNHEKHFRSHISTLMQSHTARASNATMSDNMEKNDQQKLNNKFRSGSASARAVAFRYGGELKGSGIVGAHAQNTDKKQPQLDNVPKCTIDLTQMSSKASVTQANTPRVSMKGAPKVQDIDLPAKKNFFEKSLSFAVTSPLIRENADKQRNKMYSSQIQLC